MEPQQKHGTGIIGCLAGIVLLGICGCSSTDWNARLDSELPAFGHRNWIVIADSAYPKQSAGGIETIHTGKGQLEVLNTVLKGIEAAPHVRAIAWLDAELDHVPEDDAPGIDAYRKQLAEILEGKTVRRVPHEEIIRKLDTDSKAFNILLLKSDMTIPYTSVFLQLDCGYWSAQQEQKLRAAMGGKEQ